MYKQPDATTRRIKDFLRVRPRRMHELRKMGVSVHRMNTLELQGVVFAERCPEHKLTMYYLLPEKEKEVEFGVPLKDDLPTVKGGNDARIQG